jgi:DNA-binding MarR family transcriptional regulator
MAAPYYTVESLEAGNSVGYLIKRCGILMAQIAERRFESQMISFTQWVVLTHLTERPHMTPTELSEHLGHDMGALTRIVDDLQEKQLVRRERSEEDRRAVRITVTADGRRLAKAIKGAIVLTLANEICEPFTPTETAQLISLMQRVLVRMETIATQPTDAAAVAVAASTRATTVRRGK